MKCLTPRLVSAPIYGELNGSIVPLKTLYYLVPCGKCVECLEADQRDWMLRLTLESEIRETAWFVTLTFDEDNCPDSVSVHELQQVIKSLRLKYHRLCHRLRIPENHLSYYACAEYGREKGRPHYHMMLFNFPCHDWRAMQQFVAEVWHKGFVSVEPCCPKTIGYIAKYMSKLDPREFEVPPFRLMSRRPAIAYEYFESHPELVEYVEQAKLPVIRLRDGRLYRVPRSVKRKFFSTDYQLQKQFDAAIEVERMTTDFWNDYYSRISEGKEINERKLNRIKKRFKKRK